VPSGGGLLDGVVLVEAFSAADGLTFSFVDVNVFFPESGAMPPFPDNVPLASTLLPLQLIGFEGAFMVGARDCIFGRVGVKNASDDLDGVFLGSFLELPFVPFVMFGLSQTAPFPIFAEDESSPARELLVFPSFAACFDVTSLSSRPSSVLSTLTSLLVPLRPLETLLQSLAVLTSFSACRAGVETETETAPVGAAG